MRPTDSVLATRATDRARHTPTPAVDALAGRRVAPHRGTPTRASTPNRRTSAPAPAPHGARAAALGLSLASTGALAALFAVTGGQSLAGNQVAAASVVASPDAATTHRCRLPRRMPATHHVDRPGGRDRRVVDGAVFHNKWGDVQVEVTFAADGTTRRRHHAADPVRRRTRASASTTRRVPRLNSEALTAQSAEVDTVSGATYTSNDYRRSLQSAIDAASAAGLTAIV